MEAVGSWCHVEVIKEALCDSGGDASESKTGGKTVRVGGAQMRQ